MTIIGAAMDAARATAGVLVILLALEPATAASLAEESAAVRAAGLQAYQAGRFDDYLVHLRKLGQLVPNHPDVLLRLAAAQARVGDADAALATLGAIAAMGISIDFAADARNAEDFRSISSRPEFAAWRDRNAANDAPMVTSTVWHAFSDPDLLAEDLTHDPRDGSIYVSSILRNKVVRISAAGAEKNFPLDAPERGWNPLGVQLDLARGLLWVSAQAIRGFPGIGDTDAGRSRLSAYGLKSGRRLYTREFLPEGERQAAIGDIALAPDSTLFATDSTLAKLYRVSADRKRLDTLPADLVSPQDIAVSVDGTLAFVADYARGIARFDLGSGEQTWLQADRSIALSGIDGLYVYGAGLVAVQNGTRPVRVAYLTLDPDRKRVTGVQVLDRGEVLGDPTHGVIFGDEFVYIANSGWNARDERGALKTGATATPPVLRRLKLPAAPEALVQIASGVRLLPGTFVAGTQPDGNTTIFESPQGLVVVDTGRHAAHASRIETIARGMRRPVAAIINTHWHLDHVAGNQALRRAFPAATVHASNAIEGAMQGFLASYRKQLEGLLATAAESQQASLRDEIARIDAGKALFPNRVVDKPGLQQIAGLDLYVGLETRAATRGDVWVFDPATRTLVAGDLVTLPAPLFDTACAANWKQALDHLDAMPFDRLVPGHGAPMGRGDFRRYRAAFGKLLHCAGSQRPADACVRGWLADAGELIRPDQAELARTLTDYYLNQHLRKKGKEDPCEP